MTTAAPESLFVSQDEAHPDDIRVCKRDAQGRDRCFCCVAIMGDMNDDGQWTEETIREWLEHAHLFAAAPELLAALEETVRRFQYFAPVAASDDFDDWRSQVKTALAKAKRQI